MTDAALGIRNRWRFAVAGAGLAFAGAALFGASLVGGSGSAWAQDGDASPTPTETTTATETATVTETATPTETATETATQTGTPTETATATETPTETATATPSPTEEPNSHDYSLNFRWSLLGWLGADGADIIEALQGNLSEDGDLSDDVTAVFSWDSAEQEWRAFFPGQQDVPGANDFTTFSFGQAFWIAIDDEGGLTWTVVLD